MPPVSVVPTRVTFADLQQFPDDGHRYELYDGEVIVVPAPILLHQRVALRVYDVLNEYERANGGLVVVSPIDVVFRDDTVLQPDVLFIAASRRHLVDLREPIRIPPDLVAEVLSPSTSMRDCGRKMQIYAREGVAEYWLIDPLAEILEIHALRSGAYESVAEGRPGLTVSSAVLPGLRFDVARVFAV
jgi:Uma2 family endonuclease